MKKTLKFIKVKLGLLGAVILAAIVGGITTGAVMAAIPDSAGQVNACYGNTSKSLKVTDPAGNCGSNETALSWDQSGWKGYGYINVGGTLNTSISKNITSVVPSTINGVYCIDTTFAPSLISVTNATSSSNGGLVRGADSAGDSQLDLDCGTTTEAEVSNPGNGQVYFYLR